MEINFEDLKKAHYDLIAAYYDCISTVSNLPSSPIVPMKDLFLGTNFYQTAEKPFDLLDRIPYFSLTKLRTLRFFISIFLEWHIKRKLDNLSLIYSQLEPSINPEDNGADKIISWLQEAQKGSQKFSNTFSIFSNVQSFIKFLGVIISGLLVAALSVNSIYAAIILIFSQSLNPVMVSTLIVIVIGLGYLMLFLIPAFIYKRRLLSEVKSQMKNGNLVTIGATYELENSLYNITGRAKPYEIPVDTLLMSVMIFAVTFTLIPQIFIMEASISKWVFGIIASIMFLSGLAYLYLGFKRDNK